jgi:5-methylcytosine-specific restriction endonuclease McrA
MIDVCVSCNNKKPIVNRKYYVCNDCNYKRIHGVSYIEKAVEKSKLRVKKLYRVKFKTNKQTKINKELSELKEEIERDAILNDEYFCKGCGIAKDGLDKSHIIPISKRKDLALCKENIQLLCRDCHIVWEHGSEEVKKKLLCYESNMKFIKFKNFSF